jgi:hypothetical protein
MAVFKGASNNQIAVALWTISDFPVADPKRENPEKYFLRFPYLFCIVNGGENGPTKPAQGL